MLTLATCTTLLDQLNDPKASVWVQFDKQYRPVLLAAVRRSGLTDTRADDAVQAALTTFYEQYRSGKYDREQGRLRSWLLGIARYKFIEAFRALANGPGQFPENSTSTGFAGRIPDPETLSGVIEEEWERAVFVECLPPVREEVDEKTCEAFRLYAVGGVPAEQVAEHLSITRNAVYIAKNRVLSRLRELAKEYE